MSRSSDYYPPRAGWLSYLRSARYKGRVAFRQTLGLEQLNIRLRMRDVLLSIAVPGYALKAHQIQFVGPAIAAVYVACLAGFIATLAQPMADVFFGLMIALHATSIYFLLRQMIPTWTFRGKLFTSLMIIPAIWALMYQPAARQLQRIVAPFRVGDRAFVVHVSASPVGIMREDPIAFRMKAFGGDGVYIPAGFGLGRVRGMAGDTIRFTPSHLEVNGKTFPRHEMMPLRGEHVVPEKHWFIWPDFAMQQRGRVDAARLDQILAEMAMVSENDFMGRVFERWFWRDQKIQ
jgi:hypothetical protein